MFSPGIAAMRLTSVFFIMLKYYNIPGFQFTINPANDIEVYHNSAQPQSALNWLSPIAYARLLSVYAAKVS